MRDENDNNVDDNLERLGILGGILHLQNQQKAQQQSAKQLEEVKRLREATERAALVAEHAAKSREETERAAKNAERARRAEAARIKSLLPQCPFCGGRLEGQFRKCMHCASDLSWVEGDPCEPGKETELRESRERSRQADQERMRLEEQHLQESRKTAEQQHATKEQREQEEFEQELEKLQAEMNQLTKGLPDRCPVCSCRRPGTFPPTLTGATTKALAAAKNWAEIMTQRGRCPQCWWKKSEQSTKQQGTLKTLAFVTISVIVLALVLCGLLGQTK